MPHRPIHAWLGDAAIRTAVFALIWWALQEERSPNWLYATPIIIAAACTSMVLKPRLRSRWQLRRLPAFTAFFIRESVLGAVDVARRALAPSLPARPVFYTYPLRLTDEAASVMLASVVSLLPGTVSVSLTDETLTVHVIDQDIPVETSLPQLEARVADLFGLELQHQEAG